MDVDERLIKLKRIDKLLQFLLQPVYINFYNFCFNQFILHWGFDLTGDSRIVRERILNNASCRKNTNQSNLFFFYPATKLLEHMVLNGPEGAVAAAQSECSAEVVAHIKEAVNEKDANHRDVVKKFGSSCRKLFPQITTFSFHEWEGVFDI